MDGWVVLPVLGVGLGLLGGILMAHSGRDTSSFNPWPYIVGMVGISACAAASVIWG